MNKAYLLMGGNIGDRVTYLKNAFQSIEQFAGEIVAQSSIYETAAWGMENQQPFLNQVVLVETDLAPQSLLKEILCIEETLGRKRFEKYGPRTIDIDILIYNTNVITEPNLVIPHPALPFRRFALTPLNEIAPKLNHPVLNKSIEELLEECEDGLPVEKFEVIA